MNFSSSPLSMYFIIFNCYLMKFCSCSSRTLSSWLRFEKLVFWLEPCFSEADLWYMVPSLMLLPWGASEVSRLTFWTSLSWCVYLLLSCSSWACWEALKWKVLLKAFWSMKLEVLSSSSTLSLISSYQLVWLMVEFFLVLSSCGPNLSYFDSSSGFTESNSSPEALRISTGVFLATSLAILLAAWVESVNLGS